VSNSPFDNDRSDITKAVGGVESESDEQEEHRGERQRMWQSDCGAFLPIKK
jgi:hypothetical protein